MYSVPLSLRSFLVFLHLNHDSLQFYRREFRATQESPHLQRAILRSLQRPLSVLLTNLSGILLPLLSSPAFHTAPAPTVQNPNPNPTQVHALAIAGFVEELLETFDALDLGVDVDLRGDVALKSIRDGLVSLINRVVAPLVASIHKELILILEALETPNAKLIHGAKASSPFHPSIITLQANMPVYAKAMARYTTSPASQATLATFLISVVWRGLVALAHRPYISPSPPASPGLTPLSSKKSRGTLTPPLTPPASRFTMKLPPSRPPSPPAQMAVASTAADARALFDLLNLLHRPSRDKESTRLAGEAVDDAFQGLQALPPLLEAAHSLPSSTADSQHRLNELAYKLELLATEVPLLIALPVVLQAPVPNQSTPVSVSGLIGLSETEYRSQCLSGFGRAEECATTVAFRVLATLRSHPGIHPVVSKWLGMEIAEALEMPVPA